MLKLHSFAQDCHDAFGAYSHAGSILYDETNLALQGMSKLLRE